MSVKVDDWKALERHPLSAEYKNLTGRAKTRLAESLKRGYVSAYPIILHDGKVLDGWQRQLISVELDIEPIYRSMPDDRTPEQYVEDTNDARRHEDAAVMDARAKERRNRIAAALREGKTTRQVADEEGVSKGTVGREAAQAKAEGQKVAPDAPKYPKGTLTIKEEIVCKRCHRIGDILKDCKGCATARAIVAKKLAARKPNKKAKLAKQGQAVYDFRPFRDGYGLLVRQIDALGKLYKAKDSKEAEKLRTHLAQFKAAFDSWHSSLKDAVKESGK